MKRALVVGLMTVLAGSMLACSPAGEETPPAAVPGGADAPGGQAAVVDESSQPNVVRVAVG